MTKIFVLFLILSISSKSFSETPSDDDIFNGGAFDSAVTQSQTTDEANKLEYLPGITLLSESNAIFSNDNISNYGSDSKFYGKTFFKVSKADIGSLFASANFSYFLFATASGNVFDQIYLQQSPDPEKLNSTLSELHLSFDIKKKVFLRIGKQLIGWGASYFWSPIDFVNLQKSQAQVIVPIDIRNGKPGVRIHVPLKNANIFLFTDFSSASKNNIRFQTISDTTRSSLQPELDSNNLEFIENTGQAWHLDYTFAGVNVGTAGYIAKNKPLQIGFDATGRALGADVYGEIGIGFDKKEDYSPNAAFSIGYSKAFGQERNWNHRAEFYYNDTGFGDIAISSLPVRSFTPFYSGKYYSFIEISGNSLWSSMMDLSIFGFINLADFSFSPTIQSTFDFPGVIPFTVYLRAFGGKDDREFTSLYKGPAWQAGLRIRVEL